MLHRIASTVLPVIFSLNIVFHLLVMAGIIPSDIVWGGGVASVEELYTLETISLLLNAFFLGVILVRTGRVQLNVHPFVITLLVWIMAFLFLLNTAGNMLSSSEFEKIAFTPVTLLCSFFCFVLLVKKDTDGARIR